MNRTPSSVLFAAVAFAACSAIPLRSGTVAWWHFDERDPGTTAPANAIASETTPTQYAMVYTIGSKSDYSDTTENGGAYLPVFAKPFHGLVVYDPVTGATRTNRSAMKFATARGGDSPESNSGRAWWGGMLLVADGKTLYSTCTRSITVEAFVCTTGGVFNTFAPIVASLIGRDFTNEKWAIYMETDGTISLRFNGTPYYSGNDYTGTAAINDGLWHHVAFTWDGSTVKVFVDYVQDKFKKNGALRQFSNTSTIAYGDYNQTRIGGYPYNNSNGSRKFNGLVDEVRVSDVALTPDQFLRLKESAADDDDTVLHLRFDSDSSRTLVNGEIVGERIGGPQAIFHAVSGADASTLDTAEKAGDKVSAGIYAAAASVADTASFCQSTNAMLKANYVKAAKTTNCLFPDGVSKNITNLNYTVEAFFKTRREAPIRQDVLVIGSDYRPAQFVTGDANHPHQLQFGYYTNRVWVNSSPYTPADKPCDDGNWHHVAFVSDASNKLVRAYYDYELVSEQANVYLPVAKDYSLFVGVKENGGEQFFDGWIDDVRITRRILSRDEFLTTHPVGGGEGPTPLLTALLEQDYAFACATDGYWTVTGTGAARSGGAAPVFERISRGTLLADGTNGHVSVVNEWSAKMNRSNITFPRSPLYEQDAYTVEFLAKFTGYSDSDGERAGDATLTSNAGILRFVQGNTTTFDWYLFRTSGDPNCIQLVVRGADNSLNYNVSWNLPNRIADGKWHHYAVEFAPNAVNASADVTLYYDYESMGTKNNAKGLYKGALGHRLMVCESSSGNPNILGNVDAIRFWRGNPDPSLFLGRQHAPFFMVVR